MTQPQATATALRCTRLTERLTLCRASGVTDSAALADLQYVGDDETFVEVPREVLKLAEVE